MQEGSIVYRDFNLIKQHQDEFITLYINQELVACAGLRTHESCCEIYAFAVAQNHHGQGFGSQLLEKIKSHCTSPLVALSKFQGEWFLGHGFREAITKELPKEVNYNHSRSPRIFIMEP